MDRQVQQQPGAEKQKTAGNREARGASALKEKKSFFMFILIYISHCWDRNWHLSVG
jgi:hypothetical protein